VVGHDPDGAGFHFCVEVVFVDFLAELEGEFEEGGLDLDAHCDGVDGFFVGCDGLPWIFGERW